MEGNYHDPMLNRKPSIRIVNFMIRWTGGSVARVRPLWSFSVHVCNVKKSSCSAHWKEKLNACICKYAKQETLY